MSPNLRRLHDDFRRYAERDTQRTARAREVLGVAVIDAPRPFESYANQFRDIWLDETPQWHNASAIHERLRASTNVANPNQPLPMPTQEPMTVAPKAFVAPKPIVMKSYIKGTLTGVYGFCGGATAYSLDWAVYEQVLTEEVAKEMLVDFLKELSGTFPVIYFPDMTGGRWDQLFAKIPEGTVLELSFGKFKYAFKRVASLPVIKSWNSLNDVVTHVLMGLSRTESEESFQSRKTENDRYKLPTDRQWDVNNEGKI